MDSMSYLIPTATAKMKFLISLLIAPLIVFYAPIAPLLGSIGWLVLIDIITGMYAARVIEKRTLSSRSFFRKMPQVVMFLIGLTAAIHADPFFVQFLLDPLVAAKLVVSFYGLYEFFSITENLGKSGLPVAKQITKFLQSKLPDEVKEIAVPDKEEK